LAVIIESWDRLPEALRAGIVAMVRSSGKRDPLYLLLETLERGNHASNLSASRRSRPTVKTLERDAQVEG
jgi:hypothetical protein